jgi:hypothetical protein
MKKYVVTLTEDERAALGQRVSSGRGPARELAGARIVGEGASAMGMRGGGPAVLDWRDRDDEC